ncbi:Rad17 cell cycle checkpoint protein-domain-containing protein [Gaertneriomyces semiglobifer]|nr:Rad17 cell cycle checkpoint protein-domain-containing protein [Gaertneriomyces semiglobifer]
MQLRRRKPPRVNDQPDSDETTAEVSDDEALKAPSLNIATVRSKPRRRAATSQKTACSGSETTDAEVTSEAKSAQKPVNAQRLIWQMLQDDKGTSKGSCDAVPDEVAENPENPAVIDGIQNRRHTRSRGKRSISYVEPSLELSDEETDDDHIHGVPPQLAEPEQTNAPSHTPIPTVAPVTTPPLLKLPALSGDRGFNVIPHEKPCEAGAIPDSITAKRPATEISYVDSDLDEQALPKLKHVDSDGEYAPSNRSAQKKRRIKGGQGDNRKILNFLIPKRNAGAHAAFADKKDDPVLPSDLGAEKQLWVDKHDPFSEYDCAVNSRKIGEVRSWLACALGDRSSYPQRARILALTGPSGAGKTAVLRLLSKEMHFQMLEWSNPVEFPQVQATEPQESETDVAITTGFSSVTKKFQDFLSFASRTPSLCFTNDPEINLGQPATPPEMNDRKVIVVEDLPNVSHLFVRQAVQDAIRTHARSPRTQYPLVLIITDTIAVNDADDRRRPDRESAISIRHLIPPDVLASGAATQISFNPIAHSFLVKALTRVADREYRSAAQAHLRPDKASIDAIAKASAGDIRCALNAMQFWSLKESRKPSSDGWTRVATRNVSSEQRPESTLVPIGGREINLALFHSLGKILYNKPDERVDLRPPLPAHLATHYRTPTKENPEQVFDHSHLDSDTFNQFLHQNYLGFCSEVDELVTATSYFSDADLLSGPWQHRSQLSTYTTSLISRGLMFSHTQPIPQTRYKQLHRPDMWTLLRKQKEFEAGIREMGLLWTKPGMLSTTNAAIELRGKRVRSAILCNNANTP